MPDFLNDHGEIQKHGASGNLPHWQQGEVMQFITFRLGDAMPQSKLREWKRARDLWLENHPLPHGPDLQQDARRLFSKLLETYLDQGLGSCLFKDPAAREMLAETLMRDQGKRVVHQAWVIMPNHVHLLFTPDYPLQKLVQVWKGASARRIGRGTIWQTNYRDTLIRDIDHFLNAVRYIRRNPRHLAPGTFTLWEGERASLVP